MSARTATFRGPARPAVLLLPAVLAVAGCASVSSYQKAEAQYDRQYRQNREVASAYSREINALQARQAAYQRTLAEEARLNSQNAALRQRVADLQGRTGNVRPSTRPTAPNAGLKDLGRVIDAATYGRLQQELRDYRRLEGLYDRQLTDLSSRRSGSTEYQKEAELARAQALLEVVAEALLTADVPGDARQSPSPAGEADLERAFTAFADAQDQLIVTLNDFKLQDPGRSDGSYSRGLAACRDLLAAVTDATSRLRQSRSDQDLVARLEAMRGITELARVLLTTADALQASPAPLAGQRRVAQALQGREPVARTISALLPARDERRSPAAGPLTDSELRRLNRLEWIMTMAAYCQGDTFKPETYLQIRLGEVRPLKSAVSEIVESYESSHRATVGPKGLGAPTLSKERTPVPEEPYLNSFGP